VLRFCFQYKAVLYYQYIYMYLLNGKGDYSWLHSGIEYEKHVTSIITYNNG